MDRIALVTGVTGQDGHYLVEQLLRQGTEVHGLVRPADTARSDWAHRITLHTGDLTDSAALGDLITELDPDEVYNLAGISSVGYSWDHPVETGAASGLAVAGLLEAVRSQQERSGTQIRFVQASSAEIFGLAEESPQDESTPIAPVSPYGAAKAYAHQLVHVFRARGLHASSCVFYNHESPRRPTTFVTRKITAAAAAMASGEQDHLDLGNLDARRDWGWAPDYTDAMIRAARHSTPDDYVIATGITNSVRDFVAVAMRRAGVFDWEHRVRVDPRFVRPVDATEQRGDASHAHAKLGWAPTRTFEQVVEAMVDHDLELTRAAPDARPALRRHGPA